MLAVPKMDVSRYRKRTGTVDGLRKPVPPRLKEVFANVPLLSQHIKRLKRYRTFLLKIDKHACVDRVDITEVGRLFNLIISKLESGKPFAICPMCRERGRVTDTCMCRGTEWLTRDEYYVATDESLRELVLNYDGTPAQSES